MKQLKELKMNNEKVNKDIEESARNNKKFKQSSRSCLEKMNY